MWAAGNGASAADSDPLLADVALGSPDAPVTIHEYSSLTCGHCATFHSVTLPEIKKAYIDTGKVRLVFRDFPLDNLAFAAALLPHCAGPQRYFGFLEVLFRTQATWAGSNDPLNELRKLARLGGLSATDFDACLTNQALFDAIRDRAAADGEAYGIEATPTFRVNEEKIVGGQPFEVFRRVIEQALTAAK